MGFYDKFVNKCYNKKVYSSVQPSETSGYREPAIITAGSSSEIGKYNLINSRETGNAFTNITDVATQYVNDFEKIVKSVDTYKGFYIGRYEITANGEKPGMPLTNVNWYTLYNKCLTCGTDYTESGMIYGCLWDATMQWLANSNYWVGKSGEQYTGYGNTRKETVSVSSDAPRLSVKTEWEYKKLETGQASYTKSNNIYDIAGNCYEWTQEAYSEGRVIRGSNYLGDGGFSAGRVVGYSSDRTENVVSSRPYFYIE